MHNINQSSTYGIGVTGGLGLLFIGLKLTGYITWSWWWVLSPFWIPPAIFVTFFIFFVGGYIIIQAIKGKKKGRW